MHVQEVKMRAKPFWGIFHGSSRLLYRLFSRQDYRRCLLISATEKNTIKTWSYRVWFWRFEREKRKRERETWTTSSRPLASFKRRLFFVWRRLATTKTASVLPCCSFCPLWRYFLSNLPYRLRNLGSSAALFRSSSSSYVANMVGLYSIAHIICNHNPPYHRNTGIGYYIIKKKRKESSFFLICYLPEVQSVEEGEFSPEKNHQHPNSKQILPTIEILCYA